MSESPEEMLDRVRELADDYAEWEVFSSYSEALKYVLSQAAMYREVCKQRQADQARIAELEAELDRKSAEQNQAYTTRIVDLSNSYCRASAEAAVLLKFLVSECQWLGFHADTNNDSMSYDNFRKLRAFLGEESHAHKMLDRIAELEADRERMDWIIGQYETGPGVLSRHFVDIALKLCPMEYEEAIQGGKWIRAAIDHEMKNEGSKDA